MRNIYFAGAALLVFAAPLAAQDSATEATASTAPATVTLTAEQQAMYDAWPADRRAGYDAWPDNLKGYYWTLDATQQEGWWLLNDTQRGQIFAMTPEQRTTAWASIASQMSAAASTPATPAPAATASSDMAADGAVGSDMASADAAMAAPATAEVAAPAAVSAAPATGTLQFVRAEVVQTTADAPVAAGAEVPICKPDQQDNCINSWEARKTGNRPLNYWPGAPASETDAADATATTDDD